ncbi:MAG: dCMP deaminase family protein [Bacilli bacterium]
MKREDYISWDQYFMAIALTTLNRSKDPSTQVGTCIVNNQNHILSTGYNGAPIGMPDDEFPWSRSGEYENIKYAYVCHSELNAILNCHSDLKNTKLYVSLFPCNECTKAIIQAGITEIIYYDDKYKDTKEVKVAKKMLDKCGVSYRQYEKSNQQIILNL